jgi:hypothetical protein
MQLSHPGMVWRSDWNSWIPEWMDRAPRVTKADLAWWIERDAQEHWHWAKTYADSYPHWYLPIEHSELDQWEYLRAYSVITAFGKPEKFNGRVNISLVNPEENIKWWCGPLRYPLLNKAVASNMYGVQDAPDTEPAHETILGDLYTSLAPIYDERYDKDHCPECTAENMEVWKQIRMPPPSGPWPRDLLDLGAGAGLALDLKIVQPDPKLYRGVDPSQGMLNCLVQKHQWVKDLRTQTAEEYLDTRDRRQFDTVIGLFGAPSYMTADTILRLPSLARRQVYLMHYAEGYRPDYHTDETWPEHANLSRRAAASLISLDGWEARLLPLGNFQVIHLLREGFAWR